MIGKRSFIRRIKQILSSGKNLGMMSSKTKKKCPKCKKKKSESEYYVRKERTGNARLSSYCKKCTCQERIERGRKFKQKCVDYKGGECERCGYNKSNCALDFHHKDPNEKDFGIGKQRRTKFDEKIMAELDKCMLLCANCHREKHAGLF